LQKDCIGNFPRAVFFNEKIKETKMQKTKEEIKRIVGNRNWSKLCEKAERFIERQPDDATIECIYSSEPELWYEDENAYDWKCIGYERGFYAYIIAWKPEKPHEIR
jgi:hypothetical protein